MLKLKGKKKGVSTFIVTLCGIFVLLLAVYICIYPLTKLSVYLQILDTARKAEFRIEADGGLTDTTKELIRKTISDKGLDPNLLTINCNQIITPGIHAVTTFGSDVKLTLEYKYTYNEKKIIGFNVTDGETKTEIIKVSVSTTAKN